MTEKLKVVRVDNLKRRSVDPMVEEKAELDKVGAKLILVDADTEDEVIAAATDADAIITGAARITRRVMESLPKLKVVVRYGVGYDTIDVPAATDNRVLVVNIPDFCWEEVSNHTIMLLLACSRKLVLLNNGVKAGKWMEVKKLQAPMGAIYGQTLGIIGCGNIGRMVARKAQCFSLKLLGYDPYVDKGLAREVGLTLVSLPELLKESDYITIHTFLNAETRHFIGGKEFRQMKPSAYVINASRGPVIDEPALIKALQQKLIAGAGLDVFEKEPIAPDNPLLKMDNVIVLPHSASYSDAAFKRLRTSVGAEAARVITGHRPKNLVNKDVKPKIDLV